MTFDQWKRVATVRVYAIAQALGWRVQRAYDARSGSRYLHLRSGEHSAAVRLADHPHRPRPCVFNVSGVGQLVELPALLDLAKRAPLRSKVTAAR